MVMENYALVIPGISIGRIQSNGFIIGLDGLVMLALIIERIAFANPRLRKIRIQPDGLIIGFY